ncbi:Zn(2)-C6 fungal-type DNA-binding domain [Penicillium roqueforti FM164]|uniref:Zn(2)-C6 fungal-type DNA-binding domain n=1 Tax=Penicillium roqueforti (strain FM164) TaxID=1365484 RepID=W6QR07_PENRF|nr:Zn(2)-C6 fungal-type DNA-binding domain [Penicillium roqueforti FM164]
MTGQNALRPLRPMVQASLSQLQTSPSSCGKRQNVSLACTNCRQKRTKCSGALPCANCKAKLCQCIYDPSSDRRRKSYSIESSALRQALLYTVVKLRSRARDEVKTFISKIRSLQTDRDGENFLLRESSHAIDNSR